MGKSNVWDLELYRLKKMGWVMEDSFLEMTFRCNTSDEVKDNISELNNSFDMMESEMKDNEIKCDLIGLLEPYLQNTFRGSTIQKLLFINTNGGVIIDIYDPIECVFLGSIETTISDDETGVDVILKVSGFKRMKFKFRGQTDIRNVVVTTTLGLFTVLNQQKNFIDTITDLSSIMSTREDTDIHL